jgi:hypothetical protein
MTDRVDGGFVRDCVTGTGTSIGVGAVSNAPEGVRLVSKTSSNVTGREKKEASHSNRLRPR